MTAIVPQPDIPTEATVRRLVDELRAHLAALPDHRDRRGRVYPLASLRAIHLPVAVGDGNSPEDAAACARDRGPDLLAELQPLVAQRAAACAAAVEAEAAEEEPEGREEAEALREGCAVDGKSVRRAGDADRGLARTHIVSARLDNGLTVGQAAVPDQGNELTALRPRLPALDLKDRVVTIDAMGCRTDIARTMADAEGWYRLAVQDSEANLHANLQCDFAYLDRTGAVAHDRHETVERGHGRIEHRTCTIRGGPHGILEAIDPDQRWAGLGCAVRVVAERTVRGRTTRAVRHCITNLPVDTGAARLADLVRGHRGVENSLHWVLDDTPGRTAAACAPAMPPATWRPGGASP